MKIYDGSRTNVKKTVESTDLIKIKELVANARMPKNYKDAIEYDLIKSLETGVITSARCKEQVNDITNKSIYGIFSADYFPSLAIDGVVYENLPLPSYSGIKLESPVVPVKIIEATPGFLDKTVVALFPENHLDGNQTSSDKIFYFIDKFVKRHLERTIPILNQFTTTTSFSYVKNFRSEEIEEYSVNWVWLHEYFHRIGPLPIPEYLDIKSYRPLAGLEECRVDMKAICFIHDCSHIPIAKKYKISEFIMSERILRYSVEGIPHPNYDAIGSQVLVNYLRKMGFIKIYSDKLHLEKNYIDGIRNFVSTINDIESHIDKFTRNEVKTMLIEFVNSNLNMAFKSDNYIHDPFFIMVRDNLL